MGDNVAESVVDSSEIINTLGDGGITTIGYASEAIETDGGGGTFAPAPNIDSFKNA
jgi:hypothetical protein